MTAPEPPVCRWCGMPRRDHGRRWVAAVGWHTYTAPQRVQRKSSMIGRSYLDPGDRLSGYRIPAALVTVLVGWGPGGGPRNVAVRRDDGTVQVIPFMRRLRRLPDA